MTVGLEPFPMFIDAAPAESANYFASSKMSTSLQMLSPLPVSRRPRISVSAKVSNYLHLRYYQYEVTFGLYMLTPSEKLVLNTIILAIFSFLFYALCWGLEPFVVQSICRLVYYITGSFNSAPGACSQ